MTTVTIIYNPHRLHTTLRIGGQEMCGANNRLTHFVAKREMLKWLAPYVRRYVVWNGILPELIRETNDDELDVIFEGTAADFGRLRQAFEDSVQTLQNEGYENNWRLRHVPNFDDERLCQRLAGFLEDIRQMPAIVETKEMLHALDRILHAFQNSGQLPRERILELSGELEALLRRRLEALDGVDRAVASHCLKQLNDTMDWR